MTLQTPKDRVFYTRLTIDNDDYVLMAASVSGLPKSSILNVIVEEARNRGWTFQVPLNTSTVKVVEVVPDE